MSKQSFSLVLYTKHLAKPHISVQYFWCFTRCLGAKGRFSAGFDINAFQNKPSNDKPWSLSVDFLTDIVEGTLWYPCSKPSLSTSYNFQLLFIEYLLLSDAQKPSVAAIDGIALGGGLEVAMVCLGCITPITHNSFGCQFVQRCDIFLWRFAMHAFLHRQLN